MRRRIPGLFADAELVAQGGLNLAPVLGCRKQKVHPSAPGGDSKNAVNT